MYVCMYTHDIMSDYWQNCIKGLHKTVLQLIVTSAVLRNAPKERVPAETYEMNVRLVKILLMVYLQSLAVIQTDVNVPRNVRISVKF